MKNFNLTVTFMLGVVLTPALLFAASEVVIGYANISARVSPLWIAQEKGFFTKFGVNVQQVYMPGSPVMIASMASGQVHLANSGGTAALGAAAGGLDLRVIGTFTSRIPFDLVVRSNIKNPKDLRGKRIGVQVIGGTIWMAAMLGLEHLGLDSRRDDIQVVAAGDQTMLSQALEKGTIDATVVDSAFSNDLKQRGFPTLVELSKTNIPFVSNGIVARASYLVRQPDTGEKHLESVVGRSRLRAEPADETRGDRNHHAASESIQSSACRARLPRSASRYGPKTLSLRGRSQQRAASDEIAQCRGGRSQSRESHRRKTYSGARSKRLHRPALQRLRRKIAAFRLLFVRRIRGFVRDAV